MESLAATVTKEKDLGRYRNKGVLFRNGYCLAWAKAGMGRAALNWDKVWEKDVLREERRYFITSLTDIEAFVKAVRAHWGIENSLH